jgi:hypothetical protein
MTYSFFVSAPFSSVFVRPSTFTLFNLRNKVKEMYGFILQTPGGKIISRIMLQISLDESEYLAPHSLVGMDAGTLLP